MTDIPPEVYYAMPPGTKLVCVDVKGLLKEGDVKLGHTYTLMGFVGANMTFEEVTTHWFCGRFRPESIFEVAERVHGI